MATIRKHCESCGHDYDETVCDHCRRPFPPGQPPQVCAQMQNEHGHYIGTLTLCATCVGTPIVLEEIPVVPPAVKPAPLEEPGPEVAGQEGTAPEPAD